MSVITKKQLLRFWPDILAIGGLGFPFVGGVSLLDILFGDYQGYILAAAPLALAVPIVVWKILRVLGRVTTKTELLLCYALSTGAMACALFWAIGFSLYILQANIHIWLSMWLAIGCAVALIVVNVLLLRHNLTAVIPAEVSAGVFLVGGYLPNATFWLLYWCISWPPFWDIGAYLVLASSVGYILRISCSMRKGTEAHQLEQASG